MLLLLGLFRSEPGAVDKFNRQRFPLQHVADRVITNLHKRTELLQRIESHNFDAVNGDGRVRQLVHTAINDRVKGAGAVARDLRQV